MNDVSDDKHSKLNRLLWMQCVRRDEKLMTECRSIKRLRRVTINQLAINICPVCLS